MKLTLCGHLTIQKAQTPSGMSTGLYAPTPGAGEKTEETEGTSFLDPGLLRVLIHLFAGIKGGMTVGKALLCLWTPAITYLPKVSLQLSENQF